MQESSIPIDQNLATIQYNGSTTFVDNHPILKGQYMETYERVLAHSKLKINKQIGYRNVRIYENDYIHQIYTISQQQKQLPHLVFLHGYGGTSMTAVRMFQFLNKNFHVHALDAFGLGYSSRGNFNEKLTTEQIKDYYVNAVQQWRKNLKINKFVLVGHSFGGYLSTYYAKKYPHRVSRLILLSPLGFSRIFRKEDANQQKTFRRKAFECLAQKIYNINIRPSAAMNNFLFGNKIINSIINNRLRLQDQQKQDWKLYFKQFGSQKDSSQVSFYRLFPWPLSPQQSIEDMINQNKFAFPIDFYYGDTDWMSRNGIQALLQKHTNVTLTIIPNAGHQLVFDNPSSVCNSILNRVY